MSAPEHVHRPGKVTAEPADWDVCHSVCVVDSCGIPLRTSWIDYGDPDGAAGRWSPWGPIPPTIRA